jgi:drug/metabolite transporter (DMT)-like permease
MGTRLPPEPQRGPDVLGPVVCNVAGVLLLAVAWVVTSGHPSFRAQLPSVNLGVAGVVLAGAGDVVYLVGARRLLRRRMGSLPAGLGRRMPAVTGEGGGA